MWSRALTKTSFDAALKRKVNVSAAPDLLLYFDFNLDSSPLLQSIAPLNTAILPMYAFTSTFASLLSCPYLSIPLQAPYLYPFVYPFLLKEESLPSLTFPSL